MTIPKLKTIQKIFFDEKKCLNFLLENNIIKRLSRCKSCNNKMYKERKLLFKYLNKECKKAISLFDNSFFSNQHLKCNDILFIAYLWICKANYSTISYTTSYSSITIVRYIKIFRELIINNLKDEDFLLVGENII